MCIVQAIVRVVELLGCLPLPCLYLVSKLLTEVAGYCHMDTLDMLADCRRFLPTELKSRQVFRTKLVMMSALKDGS